MRTGTTLSFLAVAAVTNAIASDLEESRFKSSDIIRRDIAIIGGGSAGTNAAIAVHDAGKSVVVIEKQNILGGHTDTYIDPSGGAPINVGVQLLHNVSLVVDYFARLGVPLYGVVPGISTPTITANFHTGRPVNVTAVSPEVQAAALQKYSTILATRYPYLTDGYFLPAPVPEELLLPFGEFAERNGLQVIVFIIHSAIQEGDIAQLPTVFVMRQFGLPLIQAFVAGFVAPTNMQDLYDSAAAALGSANVLLNARVTAMSRSERGVKLLVKTPKGAKLVLAKKLLMTGPPLLDNLHGWDLRPQEKQVFSRLSGMSYFGGVLKNPNINPNVSYANINPDDPFGLPSLPGIYGMPLTGHPDLHTLYFAANEIVDSKFARKEILASIQRLTANGVLDGDGSEIVALFDHTPFRVLFSAKDIRDGYYGKLNGLQGFKNTWWAGAALSAHDSTVVWTFNQKIVVPGLLA